MYKKIIVTLAVTWFFALGAFGAMAADIYLDINTAGTGKIEVALPDFTFPEDLSKGQGYLHLTATMGRVVKDDLAFSGFFKVVEKDGFVQEQQREDRASGRINFKEWSALGAVALVKAEVYMEDGQLALRGELFDVDKGKRIIGVKYSGDPRIYRALAHRLSEEIVYRLTGEKGVFRTRIAFVSKQMGNKELFVMDYDGYNIFRLTRDRSIVVTPIWSPSGKQLAFTSYVDNNPDLYVIHADGSGRRPLSLAQGLNVAPAWSPDGKKVAIVMSKDGNSEIYTIDVKTGELKRLTHNRATDSAPAWSPDGRRIAFTSSRSGSPQIYIMDADGKDVQRLTFIGDYNDLAAWSPRGDRLAFAGRRNGYNGRFDIYTVKVDGSDLRRLTSNTGNNESPTWSPEGRYIAFSSDRDGGIPQIYVMMVNGSGQRRITNLVGGGYSPAWSPRFKD